MSEEIELNFRTKAILTPKNFNSEKMLVAKVIFEELFVIFESEQKITGQHLREPCEFEQNQLYYFPDPKGATLEELIKSKANLSVEEITDLFKQLLIGLYVLHQQGSLGRCFTIQNTYISNNQIKLSVFGFYPNLQLTPPEYLKNNEYSLGIDMWLLGCLLYQLLTQNVLNNFKTFDEYNKFYSQLDKKRMPQQLSSLVMKMLQPAEQKRITFSDLHTVFKCVPNNDHICQFYNKPQSLSKIKFSIKKREAFNPEWAIPKEFNEKTKLLIFSTRYQKQSQLLMELQNPSPDFLPLYNKSDEEKNLYPQIWRELHFHYYKFFIMEEQINSLDSIAQYSYILWTRLCLLNMLLILKREFLGLIKDQINFLKVSQDEWNNFIKNSKQFKYHLSELKYQMQKEQKKLDTLSLEADCQQVNAGYLEKALWRQLNLDGAFVDTSQLNLFDQFKLPYRRCLQYCYYELDRFIDEEGDSDDGLFYARLRLQLIICMTINRIFDLKFDNNKQHRDINFFELKKALQIPELTCPSQVNKFLKNATLDQLKQQTIDIHKLFFNVQPMSSRNPS
ncbi:unnamed protein product (macronuclear) [Paramecium tetraurelia]|uniref:Protein kinase domain-containing protein n=1 Tax=Paramecium tetraurelia TaxID=5888 RepID=A0C162_PARTE|nr:uncharacterized protein GSPATT00034005001 [Paramecium tetraurelia]CAK64529.1 unnamed protein product [Paramecium tetraurelia]|eukprot:XP_001431927.1 hypothetical protein (macronuclear) [Paramecium tetraurelia strain d4-2]